MVTVQGYYTGASSTIFVRDVEKILRDNQNIEEINTLISNGSFHLNTKIKNITSKIKTVNNIKNQVKILKKNLLSNMDLPIVDTVESFFSLLNISISSNTNKE
jgi:multidrug efflux pump subunit AcrB